MYKFTHVDEYSGNSFEIEIPTDDITWYSLVENFNYFLAGCGFVSHFPKDDFQFCEPKQRDYNES